MVRMRAQKRVARSSLLTLEGPDDERAGGGDNRDLCLTVLDSQLDSDSETLPVAAGLGNVFTDLLGRLQSVKRKGTKAGQRRNSSPWSVAPFGFVVRTKPSGPILGASADEAPTSPPTARR